MRRDSAQSLAHLFGVLHMSARTHGEFEVVIMIAVVVCALFDSGDIVRDDDLSTASSTWATRLRPRVSTPLPLLLLVPAIDSDASGFSGGCAGCPPHH